MGKIRRKSITSTMGLAKHFIKTSKSTSTLFSSQKIGGKVAVIHGNQQEAFETAHQAISRDMTRLFKELSRAVHDGMELTYSVHRADINGLSRLECWLLDFEISQYLGMCYAD
jgi:hypothetical protein